MARTFALFAVRSFEESSVYKGVDAAIDEPEFLFALQCLFWVLADCRCPDIPQLTDALRIALDATPLIDMRIARRGAQVTLYPKGARLLDEAAVNDTLAWLGNHPPVARHFENALQMCLRGDVAHYRNLLDELRAALEKLIRGILNNRKSLEKQKPDLLVWMKKRGAHAQVRNMYTTLVFGHFATYQNNAVKHGDGWAESDVEFMIYLTGTFMRFLLQLNGDDATWHEGG